MKMIIHPADDHGPAVILDSSIREGDDMWLAVRSVSVHPEHRSRSVLQVVSVVVEQEIVEI